MGVAVMDFEQPNAWSSQQLIAEENAHSGSERLRLACTLLFSRFANQHRIKADEARILLLDTGVRI
jgi:hypothetical protein